MYVKNVNYLQMMKNLIMLEHGKKYRKVVLFTKKYYIKIKAKKVYTKDTVGAGDSFIAGVIFYLEKFKKLDLDSMDKLKKENWVNCIEFASVVASKNCSREGCDPPNIKEVSNFINKCRVGLCLSSEEGGMYASTQYLLCGLPVVTTNNIGGRNTFFHPDYVYYAEDDSRDIAHGVEELKNRKFPYNF